MVKNYCWKKVRDGWKNKNGQIIQIKKVNFSWEKPAHNVIIHDSKEKSLESQLGKVKQVKYLGEKKEAIEFANQYIKNNKC